MSHAPSPTDEELLRRIREGDRKAFGTLVDRYEEVVASTVIGMLGRGPDAEDAGQETFIRFYRSIDRFRGESSLKTYLTRIAINQSLKAISRRRRWIERFFSRDASGEEMDLEDPGAMQVFEGRERDELVQSALHRLSPEHRAVVVLRVLEGYDTNETAKMLGIRPGTVMSRLSRALARMQAELGEAA